MKKTGAKSFKRGQAVMWDASQGTIEGTVERTVTKTTKVKGHVAKASPEHPEVLVKSKRTGAEAVHRPEELRPAGTSASASKAPSKRKTAGNRKTSSAKKSTSSAKAAAKRTPAGGRKASSKRKAAK